MCPRNSNTLGPVRVMEAGVVVMMCVEEVRNVNATIAGLQLWLAFTVATIHCKSFEMEKFHGYKAKLLICWKTSIVGW